MAKLKAKKAVSKTAHSKTIHRRVGRPAKTSVVLAKSNPRTNGAPHHNGNGNGNGNGAPGSPAAVTDTAVDSRLDAGSIRTKSGVDLTEKVRELLILAK